MVKLYSMGKLSTIEEIWTSESYLEMSDPLGVEGPYVRLLVRYSGVPI